MSHFCMWAITKTESEDELDKVMQPYHEYECAGYEDEYVVHVDETKDVLEKWEKEKTEYSSLREFLNDWYCCEEFFNESDTTFEEPNERYAIISDDGTKLIKYCDYTNPNAKWDWWVLGGRWSEDKDCFKKSEFDYDKWYDEQVENLTKTYRTVKPLIDVKTVIRWEDVKHLPRESAEREAYYNQPTRKALNDADIWGISWEEIMDLPEEEYVTKHMSNTAPCFGYVNSDGWFEKAEMGWFACTSNEKEDWGEHFKKYWESLPDDAVIWNVDCHI